VRGWLAWYPAFRGKTRESPQKAAIKTKAAHVTPSGGWWLAWKSGWHTAYSYYLLTNSVFVVRRYPHFVAAASLQVKPKKSNLAGHSLHL